MPISHGHRPNNYNQFVPETEAKDLIHVAQLKQNLYDQGVAQIQSQIDQFSTLPLVRDADKKYLNQELDKYYQVIQNNVGSADFSNPTSVKSFLDISRPLENDPILKNAITSTQEYMDRRNTLDDVMKNKPGDYSAANAWDYMNDVESWINDPNPGAKLSKKYYNPFIDNSKVIHDTLQDLKPDIDSRMRNLGNFISEDEKTFLTQEAIRDGIMARLNPQQINQLDIDARYNASNLSKDEKLQTVLSAYQGIHDTYAGLSRIKGIENVESEPGDYAKQALAIREIASSIVGPNGYVDENRLNRLYSNLYISNWANGIGKAYDYEQTKSKWETNPYSLAAFNAKQQLNSYKEKYIFKLEQDFEQAKKTGDIIPDGKGGWMRRPKSGQQPKFNLKIFSYPESNTSVLNKLKQGGSYTLGKQELSSSTTEDFRTRLASILEDRNGISGLFDDKGKPNLSKVQSMTVTNNNGMLEYNVNVGDQTYKVTDLTEFFSPSEVPATTPTETIDSNNPFYSNPFQLPTNDLEFLDSLQ